MHSLDTRPFHAAALFGALAACAPAAPPPAAGPGPDPEGAVAGPAAGPAADPELEAFLDDVQRRTFDFFWETADPATGLVPDRWPSNPFASIAAMGFGLTAYGVGVERGWVSREEARARVVTTLRHLWRSPQGPEPEGVIGDRGFFYHFLENDTGLRHVPTELSTIDTALLLGGVLFAQSYFDGDDPAEAEIRALADSIYVRVEWPYFDRDEQGITMAWRPEPDRLFGPGRWRGYDESMILHVLGLGSPTHPLDEGVWERYTSTYDWQEFYGHEHLNFAPLFGHQYSHVWIDFRGIQDAYMRERGIDYFENSRRATLAQREYAIDNPDDWAAYGPNVWGLTASDGPGPLRMVIDGREREFRAYWARGAAAGDIRDDGTVVPTAAGGSIPFAPEETIAALREMRARWGEHLYDRYGFRDAFNPTLTTPEETRRGAVVPGVGWFDDDYIGIDQGPIVLMIENHRTGLIWETIKRNPHIVRGLCRAGFRGGWLEGRCDGGRASSNFELRLRRTRTSTSERRGSASGCRPRTGAGRTRSQARSRTGAQSSGSEANPASAWLSSGSRGVRSSASSSTATASSLRSTASSARA